MTRAAPIRVDSAAVAVTLQYLSAADISSGWFPLLRTDVIITHADLFYMILKRTTNELKDAIDKKKKEEKKGRYIILYL